MEKFIVRPGVENDHACVYATWLNSYRHGSNFPRKIPDKIYFKEQHDIIESVLMYSSNNLVIACTSENTDVILGWACYENGVGNETCGLPALLHYVYVKPAFRRSGVATKLLGNLNTENMHYTHETFVLRLPGISSKITQALFNPYCAKRPQY